MASLSALRAKAVTWWPRAKAAETVRAPVPCEAPTTSRRREGIEGPRKAVELLAQRKPDSPGSRVSKWGVGVERFGNPFLRERCQTSAEDPFLAASLP